MKKVLFLLLISNVCAAQKRDTAYVQIAMEPLKHYSVYNIPKPKSLENFVYDSVINAYIICTDKLGIQFTPTVNTRKNGKKKKNEYDW